MQALAAADIVTIWEAGARQHRLDRALTLLMTSSDAQRADLARVSIGERDRRLWALREATFGPMLEGVASCPTCGDMAEFRLLTSDVCPPCSDSSAEEYEVTAGEWQVRFRLPNSRDLAATVKAGNGAKGEAELARRCVLRVGQAGKDVEYATCPESVREALDREMVRLDPQADVHLALACPVCGHGWLALLDIAEFFWTELAAAARKLVGEVDVIARAYGWSEREILSMTSSRRQIYTELASR